MHDVHVIGARGPGAQHDAHFIQAHAGRSRTDQDVRVRIPARVDGNLDSVAVCVENIGIGYRSFAVLSFSMRGWQNHRIRT